MNKLDRFDNFIFDLDGTIFTSGTNIGELTIKVINKLHELGKNIYVATGRSGNFIFSKLESLNLKTPVISANGHLIIDNDNQIVMPHQPIKPEVMEELLKLFIEHKVYAFAFTSHGMYIIQPDEKHEKLNQEAKIKFERYELLRHEKARLKLIDNYDKLNKLDVLKFEVPAMYVDAYIAELFQRVANKHEQDLEVFFPSDDHFEIQAPYQNKGSALEFLAKKYNLDLKRTIAFGDSVNDLTKAQTVGHFVAVQNGISELKAISHDITNKTNKEEGVADYIINVLGLKL